MYLHVLKGSESNESKKKNLYFFGRKLWSGLEPPPPPMVPTTQKYKFFFLTPPRTVAMVLDRLFLWVFGVAAIVGSMMILTESPSLFETTDPIDVKISKIASEEARVLASLA